MSQFISCMEQRRWELVKILQFDDTYFVVFLCFAPSNDIVTGMTIVFASNSCSVSHLSTNLGEFRVSRSDRISWIEIRTLVVKILEPINSKHTSTEWIVRWCFITCDKYGVTIVLSCFSSENVHVLAEDVPTPRLTTAVKKELLIFNKSNSRQDDEIRPLEMHKNRKLICDYRNRGHCNWHFWRITIFRILSTYTWWRGMF